MDTEQLTQASLPDASVDLIARVCHEANRAYCASIGDDSQKPWNEAEEWQRKSARDGVLFRMANRYATPEQQHESWMEAKIQDGWTHGPEKNTELKTHPCMVPYDALPVEQRKKDALFVAIFDALV